MRSATATLPHPTHIINPNPYADWQRFIIRNSWVHRLRATSTWAWWQVWK